MKQQWWARSTEVSIYRAPKNLMWITVLMIPIELLCLALGISIEMKLRTRKESL
jgi:hypothetical protein